MHRVRQKSRFGLFCFCVSDFPHALKVNHSTAYHIGPNGKHTRTSERQGAPLGSAPACRWSLVRVQCEPKQIGFVHVVIWEMTTEVLVRDARREGLEGLLNIHYADHPAIHRDRLQDAAEHHLRLLVAEYGDAVAGFGLLVFTRPPTRSDSGNVSGHRTLE
jgi:hypothetical protein